MDLNLIPPDLYNAVFEGMSGSIAIPLILYIMGASISIIGGGAAPSYLQLSSDLMMPFDPFIQHYLQINGAG
ncbi:hypothetical protein [Corynebacterium sp. A21]|uniref:hypothetical protein n=1 Tax=Corynebacterium sp. A21 TaxID=3457318 RepID=UPI003FD32623